MSEFILKLSWLSNTRDDRKIKFYLQQKQIYFEEILKTCETKDSYEIELRK